MVAYFRAYHRADLLLLRHGPRTQQWNQRLPGRPRLRCEPCGVLALVFSIAAALARLFVGPVIDNGKCSLVIIAGIAILIAGTALSAVVQGIPSSQSAVCCKAWALAQQQQQPRPPQQASYRKNGSAKALDTTASDSYRHEHRPAFALYLVGTIPQRTSMSALPWLGLQACNRPQRTL